MPRPARHQCLRQREQVASGELEQQDQGSLPISVSRARQDAICSFVGSTRPAISCSICDAVDRLVTARFRHSLRSRVVRLELAHLVAKGLNPHPHFDRAQEVQFRLGLLSPPERSPRARGRSRRDMASANAVSATLRLLERFFLPPLSTPHTSRITGRPCLGSRSTPRSFALSVAWSRTRCASVTVADAVQQPRWRIWRSRSRADSSDTAFSADSMSLSRASAEAFLPSSSARRC